MAETDLAGLPEESDPQAGMWMFIEEEGVATRKLDFDWFTSMLGGNAALAAHLADPTAAHAASAVSATAGTTLSNTTVQGQLTQADVAIGANTTGLANHIADATDAHDASAVSFDPTGLDHLTGSDVQSVLEEVDALLTSGGGGGDISGHLADGSDAHDASAISFVPTGTIAGTDLQTAVAEVAADAANLVTAEAALRVAGDADVANDLADHITDAASAHEATAIEFTPAGGLTSDNVQDAIVEAAGLVSGGGISSTDADTTGWQFVVDEDNMGSNLATKVPTQQSVKAYADTKQPLDTDLTAIAALTSAANKLPYATGAGTWSLTDLSAFIRTLLDDADAATARATLGLAIGTNVQAFDTELAALAGLTSAANKIPRFTGSGTAGLLDFVDEDAMTSNSATALPSQQSVKAYVDGFITNIRLESKWDAGTSTYKLLDGSAIPTSGARPITHNSQHDPAAAEPPGPYHTADEWHYAVATP